MQTESQNQFNKDYLVVRKLLLKRLAPLDSVKRWIHVTGWEVFYKADKEVRRNKQFRKQLKNIPYQPDEDMVFEDDDDK